MNIKENLKEIIFNFICFTAILTIVGIFNQNAFSLKYFLICLALAVQCQIVFPYDPKKEENYNSFDDFYNQNKIKIESNLSIFRFKLYGRQLEQISKEIENLEIYSFLLPRDFHPGSKKILEKIFNLDPFLLGKGKEILEIKQESDNE